MILTMRCKYTNYVIEGKGVYGKQDSTPSKEKKVDGGSRPEENYIDNH